jgi:hypothetical protein
MAGAAAVRLRVEDNAVACSGSDGVFVNALVLFGGK